MINKNESDSYKPIINNPLQNLKDINSKEKDPLTEHYEVKGFTGVDNSKKTQDYNIY